MSNENKSTKKSNSSSSGIIAIAAALIPIVAPKIIDNIEKQIEKREKMITVPELYSEKYPLTVEQAVERLKLCGLSATLVKASLNDARPKYRNYFNSQVISSHPKKGQKVALGSSISVKYITQEVIEKSQNIFEDNERTKLLRKLEKDSKRSSKKEKVRHITSKTVQAAKSAAKKIPLPLHKKENKSK